MPSKRDSAKQRRQAENRAQRAAREARREAANRPRAARPAESSSAPAEPASGSDRPARLRRPRGGAFAGKPPGYRAAFLALLFSIGSFASVAISNPEVDEDGRAYSFTELTEIQDRRDAGEEIPEERRNGLAAAWPLSALLVLPIGVGALAVVAGQRAADPTRAWMRCMFAAVVFALIAASIPPGYTVLYFPMVIALGVATFQSRKAQAQAQVAGEATAAGGGVIEATSTEETGGTGSADLLPADEEPAIGEADPPDEQR
jgi:hypothetical protein